MAWDNKLSLLPADSSKVYRLYRKLLPMMQASGDIRPCNSSSVTPVLPAHIMNIFMVTTKPCAYGSIFPSHYHLIKILKGW
ncbi:hypothetical protein CWB99_04720 [Pseudoalteromonas rubra]|uniref:Uncharacterized protein n=1 Tax=Pseudoalteromonas rubra TaxID=43658 RepID=A0A5S3WRK5_9GAMM|nr:hypothetical protein CWB99_04720 [Pseudoalteromonas rubra]